MFSLRTTLSDNACTMLHVNVPLVWSIAINETSTARPAYACCSQRCGSRVVRCNAHVHRIHNHRAGMTGLMARSAGQRNPMVIVPLGVRSGKHMHAPHGSIDRGETSYLARGSMLHEQSASHRAAAHPQLVSCGSLPVRPRHLRDGHEPPDAAQRNEQALVHCAMHVHLHIAWHGDAGLAMCAQLPR